MTSRELGAALRRARDMLAERGEVPAGMIDATVARSWERCIRNGLATSGRLSDAPHLSAAELARGAARQFELISNARPVMEYVFAQTRNSGSIVVLADARGMLLQSVGDTDFMNRADRVALAPGSCWHESARGTNAIGTALAECAPVAVHGAEHYLERNSFLTCAAAPIAAPDGRILGVLDISGDHRSRHPHTFGLVRAAAQMIENRLFDARHGDGMRLRFHPLAEGIGTVAEGVCALSEDGWIVGANQAGLALLGLAPADLGATPLARVLGCGIDELLAWAGRRPGIPLLVERPACGRLYLRIEPGRRPLPAACPAPAAANADALAALDSGDPRMRHAIERARRVLGKPIALLLQGESGVGKEVFARAAHEAGPRRGKPFIAVNCAALPETLIEAELFGYEPGAFTGARRDGAPGRIREAHGGTLFLDEIGDMPLALQGRLLRVLQERQVTPLGGGKAAGVDFNLVCASHRDLKAEIDAGRFRADLYYRINGLTLMLPPLRERGDFEVLVGRLLEESAPGRAVALDSTLAERFRRYPWPGNLRQLANALRTACAMLDDGEAWIGMHHLSEDLAHELDAVGARRPAPELPQSDNLQHLSNAMIDRAVLSSAGNMSEAARRLGISRNTLYRRLKQRGRM